MWRSCNEGTRSYLGRACLVSERATAVASLNLRSKPEQAVSRGRSTVMETRKREGMDWRLFATKPKGGYRRKPLSYPGPADEVEIAGRAKRKECWRHEELGCNVPEAGISRASRGGVW